MFLVYTFTSEQHVCVNLFQQKLLKHNMLEIIIKITGGTNTGGTNLNQSKHSTYISKTQSVKLYTIAKITQFQ